MATFTVLVKILMWCRQHCDPNTNTLTLTRHTIRRRGSSTQLYSQWQNPGIRTCSRCKWSRWFLVQRVHTYFWCYAGAWHTSVDWVPNYTEDAKTRRNQCNVYKLIKKWQIPNMDGNFDHILLLVI